MCIEELGSGNEIVGGVGKQVGWRRGVEGFGEWRRGILMR